LWKKNKKIKKEEYRKIINEKKIKNYISNRKVDRPEYQILIKEIEEIGYSATGRKYGVSDNAIRKWVKTYEKLKK
jgi:transposase-like protein